MDSNFSKRSFLGLENIRPSDRSKFLDQIYDNYDSFLMKDCQLDPNISFQDSGAQGIKLATQAMKIFYDILQNDTQATTLTEQHLERWAEVAVRQQLPIGTAKVALAVAGHFNITTQTDLENLMLKKTSERFHRIASGKGYGNFIRTNLKEGGDPQKIYGKVIQHISEETRNIRFYFNQQIAWVENPNIIALKLPDTDIYKSAIMMACWIGNNPEDNLVFLNDSDRSGIPIFDKIHPKELLETFSKKPSLFQEPLDVIIRGSGTDRPLSPQTFVENVQTFLSRGNTHDLKVSNETSKNLVEYFMPNNPQKEIIFLVLKTGGDFESCSTLGKLYEESSGDLEVFVQGIQRTDFIVGKDQDDKSFLVDVFNTLRTLKNDERGTIRQADWDSVPGNSIGFRR